LHCLIFFPKVKKKCEVRHKPGPPLASPNPHHPTHGSKHTPKLRPTADIQRGSTGRSVRDMLTTIGGVELFSPFATAVVWESVHGGCITYTPAFTHARASSGRTHARTYAHAHARTHGTRTRTDAVGFVLGTDGQVAVTSSYYCCYCCCCCCCYAAAAAILLLLSHRSSSFFAALLLSSHCCWNYFSFFLSLLLYEQRYRTRWMSRGVRRSRLALDGDG
jgi:hypothetical protein